MKSALAAFLRKLKKKIKQNIQNLVSDEQHNYNKYKVRKNNFFLNSFENEQQKIKQQQ